MILLVASTKGVDSEVLLSDFDFRVLLLSLENKFQFNSFLTCFIIIIFIEREKACKL